VSLLCLTAAGLAVSLSLQSFTLAWTHSIEKVRWEEDYRLGAAHLVLEQARIRGSGAGMEPPAGAVLRDGAWHYTPMLAPLERVQLTRSGFVADYEFCSASGCRPLSELVGPTDAAPLVDMHVCTLAEPAAPQDLR
jgi:hypothetical protein